MLFGENDQELTPAHLQFINLASGSNLPVGTDSGPCTKAIQHSDPFTLDGRSIVLIDTPGFSEREPSVSRAAVLKTLPKFLSNKQVHIGARHFPIFRTELLILNRWGKKAKLSGIIHIHHLPDPRPLKISRDNVGLSRKLCGDKTSKNTVFVTNMWGEVSRYIGEAREKELSDDKFKVILDDGAQMVRHQDTRQSAHDAIRMITRNLPGLR